MTTNPAEVLAEALAIVKPRIYEATAQGMALSRYALLSATGPTPTAALRALTAQLTELTGDGK